ncbi:hypothetical protein BGZ60DRAFT_260576 [Tricladium varicosporioides]|nr:hypothetical protein BGZ60DRAFT_260576 [Hymenoscyphus varicosporioides]
MILHRELGTYTFSYAASLRSECVLKLQNTINSKGHIINMGAISKSPMTPKLSSARYIRFSSITSVESAYPEDFVDCLKRHDISQTLATCSELLIVSSCSLITTAYTLHHEIRNGSPPESRQRILAFDPGYVTFILDPSPAVMLVACILEGCAISSFAFRRQTRDRYQAPLFVFAIVGATITGISFGVDSNVIMLGLIPWAVFFAMMLSTVLHW